MLLLHASLIDAQLVLWGECSATLTPARKAARRAKATATRSLPFAAPLDDLRAAFALTGSTSTPQELAAAEATAWLPTIKEQPLASSPLIAPPPAPEEPPTLVGWRVPTLALTSAQTLDLLCACLDRETLAPGVFVGKPLAFWTTAFRLAGALVAREQFLPDVVQQNGHAEARWTPLLQGADAQHAVKLAQAMPAACRALTLSEDASPTTSAATQLQQFLQLMIDTLVRSSLATTTAAALRPGKRAARQTGTLHEQWLQGLRSPSVALTAPAQELTSFVEQVRSWQRPLAQTSAAPFRLCFRLEEPLPTPEAADDPSGEESSWRVRYLLQAQDDPSLQVPAADVWQQRGLAAKVLQRAGFQAREYLLAALGQAASLCREVELSLSNAGPAGFAMLTSEALRFLQESAPALEQAGFGVFLPAWWTRRGTRQRLALTVQARPKSSSAGSGLRLEELVAFDWRVAVGDQELTLQELQMLAKLKSPLVQVRGQWIQVNPEDLQAALKHLQKQTETTATVRDLIHMQLGIRQPTGLPVEHVRAEGWLRELVEQLAGAQTFKELPAPAGFTGTLRPYQLRGYSWLAFLSQWGLGACLADDMGLGKTVQTLALLQAQRAAGEQRPTLLVCPMSVVGNWQKEAARFTPELAVLVHHGLKRTRSDAFAKEAAAHALVLSSYALLHRDSALLGKVEWAGVILDEAQNIKNPDTKQAHAARALPAQYRIALTGTPVENHVGDLWSIWQFLNPGFLGTQTEFRRSFFVPIQVQHDAEAATQLKRRTGPFLLRRLKTDKSILADLPDKLEMKVYCNLTKEQATLYAAVVKELSEALDDSDGIKRKGVILATLARLKQVCNHPAHFLADHSPLPGRSGKLARLTEMLDEVLQSGERALIFTQFTEMGELLRKDLQESFGKEVLFLHGGVPRKKRDALVASFQAEGGPQLFILSLKAGGTGLNLTAASHVFHYDRWWNPAVENQATDRAFRIGQQRNVQVHKFICVGTVEEKIDDMLERKKDIAARVVGSGEGWLTEMSNEDLRELIALRADAVAAEA